MSATETTQPEVKVAADQLPSVNDAYTTVFRNIYATAFFEKLASYGVVPSSDDEAVTLLKMGEDLMMLPDPPPANRFAKAANDLSQHLGRTVEQEKMASASHLQTVAAKLAENPEIYRSVLALKKAEAEHYAQAG